MVEIYVDADACPVKETIITAAIRHGRPVYMVCNGGIRPHPHPLIQLVIVPAEPDAADKWIADTISAGDILITSDMPLAEKAVHSGASVLQPNGKLLDSASIGSAIATRDLMTDIRAADPFHISKGKPFGAAGRARFSQKLDELLHSRAKLT